MANNLNDYFTWVGFLAILIILLSNEKIEKPIQKNTLIAYPFLIFFSFIILYLQSENIPHINSAMGVFFSLLAFISFHYLKNKLPRITSNKTFLISLLLIIGYLNFSFINDLEEKNILTYTKSKET